jgi:hypothetical protein
MMQSASREVEYLCGTSRVTTLVLPLHRGNQQMYLCLPLRSKEQLTSVYQPQITPGRSMRETMDMGGGRRLNRLRPNQHASRKPMWVWRLRLEKRYQHCKLGWRIGRHSESIA